MAIPYVFLPPEIFAKLLQCLHLPPDVFAQVVRMRGMALPIMRLPPEIFAQIISYLPSNTLKSLRLTCKAFEPWTTPPLFEKLVISSGYADLEIANRVIDRFASVVRHIRVCSQPFDDVVTKDNFVGFKWPDGRHKKQFLPFIHCEPHYEQFWKVWSRLRAEESELDMTTRPLDTLCRAFASSMQISRVTLTNVYRPRTPVSTQRCWCVQAATEAQRRVLGPWSSLTERESWPVEQDTLYARPKSLNLAWTRLMQALKMTQRTIQEIVLKPTRYGEALITNVFADRLEYAQTTSRTFASLTRLKLALDAEDDPMLSGLQLERAGFVSTFSLAVNLVHLNIGVQKYWYKKVIDSFVPLRTHFDAIFEGCILPRLRTLKLDGVSTKPEQLLKFLGSHNCLVDVTLFNCGFERKTLPLLVQGVRNTTCVNVLRLGISDYVDVPRGEGPTYRPCETWPHCKTFARDDGSSLIVYGR